MGSKIGKVINPIGYMQGHKGSDLYKNILDPGGAFGDHGLMDAPAVPTIIPAAKKEVVDPKKEKEKARLEGLSSAERRKRKGRRKGILTTDIDETFGGGY